MGMLKCAVETVMECAGKAEGDGAFGPRMALAIHHAAEHPKAVSSLRLAPTFQDRGLPAQAARAKTIVLDDQVT